MRQPRVNVWADRIGTSSNLLPTGYEELAVPATLRAFRAFELCAGDFSSSCPRNRGPHERPPLHERRVLFVAQEVIVASTSVEKP
ncbi:MAG: hypothetical protein K9N51_13635 [Candidatus Pacebacteria bacterium]|nr:hypothetical protein [Candidatus Paceibacterota bacterium]